MDANWFEFREIRRRRLGDVVWVPLWAAERLRDEGEFGSIGYTDEYFGIGSLAIPVERREQGQELRWSELGGHSQGVWATKSYYKPVDVYQYHGQEDVGVELALIQRYPTDDLNECHLNQDLVFALGLRREGDTWIKPDEDYVEVARLRRGADREPVALEIKNEFLRDYLCARGMYLRTTMYRKRAVVIADPADVGSPVDQTTHTENERFEIRTSPMIEGGHFGNGSFAVFHVGRTDVDPDEDVPLPGPETATNTESSQWSGKHTGRTLAFVSGELWRDEDIEPGEVSVRVRGDKVPTGLQFIVDASGARASSEELNNEGNARWLWFRPEVVPAITSRRSGNFAWYTMDTGGVGFSGGTLTHFGINSVGLVNVYAYDIAKLDLWQQRLWAGYNVPPEGGVSRELLASQMQARPAKTTAPERALADLIEELNEIFSSAIGAPLFRPHAATNEVLKTISRFRALSPGGVYALAKDLMRLIADQVDTGALQKVVAPPKGEKWGSLKSLENYLATLISADKARAMVGPLVGAYELRLADAHMPQKELDNAFKLARVNPGDPPLLQGFRLIASVASALIDIATLVAASATTAP